MRDRLVELWGYAIESCKSFSCAECEHNNIGYPKCMDVHIADYLLANGVIVPKCKIGQDIYRIGSKGQIYDEWQVAYIQVYEDEILYIDDSDNYFYDSDIGKTVFLTREEAEAKLKGDQ